MARYSIESATQEIDELEAVLTPIVEKYLEKNKPTEVAKALVIVNKERYRYEEAARRLRLTGELDLDIYETLVSGYRSLSNKILRLSYEYELAPIVSMLHRALRFSSETAGIYLAEYLESVTE